MKGYVLSILGIALCGVLIDAIMPSGSTSKYIKSIFSIFVVAVILNPVINFFAKAKNLEINYNSIEVNQKLINYIANQKVEQTKNIIIFDLNNQGISNIYITLNFALENNEIVYNSCFVNIKNIVYNPTDKHISKYELITEVVKQHTNLNDEVIIFDEWKWKENQI